MEATKSGQSASSQNVYMARQPIFGKGRTLEGYELLFRGAPAQSRADSDGDSATMEVISASMMLFGLEKLIGTTRAFINFTEGLLRSETVSLLPPDRVVVEIPETISDDPDTVVACIRLKQQGYVLALDNFAFQPALLPLLDVADYVKVDFQATDADDRVRVVQTLARGTKLVACKLETKAEYDEAESLGFGYFQGFFFCRPNIVSRRSLPISGLICMEALNEVCKPEIDFDRVSTIIMRDVSFTYKLLRFVNSAAMGLRTRIHSIKQALVILGAKESARWLSLVALRDFGGEKPEEVVVTSIVRGRMAELMAPHVGLKVRAPDLFLLGVFSAIDALVDRPLEEAVSELPLAEDVQDALLGEANPLYNVLAAVLAYERCDWAEFARLGQAMGLKDGIAPDLYMQAVAWANEFYPDLRGQ